MPGHVLTQGQLIGVFQKPASSTALEPKNYLSLQGEHALTGGDGTFRFCDTGARHAAPVFCYWLMLGLGFFAAAEDSGGAELCSFAPAD
jgi:hypothetical protein